MEDAKSLVKKLLQDPYQSVLLQDYDKVIENRKKRKKLEEIEKELAWFNGKSSKYKMEDRQGFLKHFQKNYGQDRIELAVRYRSVCDYPMGREPKFLYFVLLFEKRWKQLQEFQTTHPLAKVRQSISLALEYRKLLNEYRLLAILLEQLPSLVTTLEKSIDECFLTDFLDQAESSSLPVLQNRFYRAIRLAPWEVSEKLLELIKNAGAKDTDYMDAMLALKKKDYRRALSYVKDLPKDHPSYSAAKTMAMECCANIGDISGFIAAFKAVSDSKMDAMYFIYLLQLLVCNADYKELDTDEFEESIQSLLKSEFNQNSAPMFTGLVARKFVSILLEGLPIAEKLAKIKKEHGEDAIPTDELEKLYKLQMALQLYPVEEVGNLIDIDYIEEHGEEECRRKLGRQALAMLLEKNPDKSFENIYLAFSALEQVGMMDAYVKNIEANLESIAKYGENGQERAYAMIYKAYEAKKNSQEDTDKLEEILKKAGILK